MGATRVGPQATREDLAQMRERYERAKRAAKGGLLNEVCQVTGYHRKAVIRLLRRPAPTRGGPAARPARGVRRGGHDRAGRDLDGGRLSLVGTAEGAPAGLAAVGAPPIAADVGDRAGGAAHQCAPD
jgi:hypothetical protein